MTKNTEPLYTLIDKETKAEILRRVTKIRRQNTVIIEAIAATKNNYPTVSDVTEVDFGPAKKNKPKAKRPRTAAQIGKELAKLGKPKKNRPIKKAAKKSKAGK